MSDLLLATKRAPGTEPVPIQNAKNISEFFGEQSNDLQLNSINDLAIVSGLEKLRQDINKILLTERGTNSLFELYGTELQSLIGGKINPDVIRAKIKDEVIGGLQTLQFLNRDNPNADERPEVLELLDIQQIDTTQFEIKLSVITASNKSITTGIVISI